MELFTLLVNPAAIDAERVAKSVRRALGRLRKVADGLELRLVPLTGGTGIVCDISPVVESDASAARQAAARPLAEAIIDAYETGALERCIRKALEDDDPESFDAVRNTCMDMLEARTTDEGGADPLYERRVAKLAGALASFLEEQPYLHVEGFLRFRAEPYMEELRDTVHYAVDEWLMERQYQEFVSLLKYFVYIQEAKIPAAHVIHRGHHEFSLLNERMLPIDTKQMDQFVVELIDKDVNYEDVIVSTLISISPAKLYVHTRTPEEQVIQTMLTIFEGRAELCTDCRLCVPPQEERGGK